MVVSDVHDKDDEEEEEENKKKVMVSSFYYSEMNSTGATRRFFSQSQDNFKTEESAFLTCEPIIDS